MNSSIAPLADRNAQGITRPTPDCARCLLSHSVGRLSFRARVLYMHILIVKKGALGDVVRTSYFAKSLKRKFGPGLRLSWITAPASADLLRLNPNIADLWFEFEQAKPFRFD